MLKPPAPFGHGRTNNRSIRMQEEEDEEENEKNQTHPGLFPFYPHRFYALRVDALVFAPFKSLNLSI